MRYTTGAAFRAALDQRLKTQAERTQVALARLRKRVAFELFLRRLIAVAPGGWVLKGAFALDLRLGVGRRPTKDIDLGRDDSPDAAIEDVVAGAEDSQPEPGQLQRFDPDSPLASFAGDR